MKRLLLLSLLFIGCTIPEGELKEFSQNWDRDNWNLKFDIRTKIIDGKLNYQVLVKNINDSILEDTRDYDRIISYKKDSGLFVLTFYEEDNFELFDIKLKAGVSNFTQRLDSTQTDKIKLLYFEGSDYIQADVYNRISRPKISSFGDNYYD